VNTLRRPTGDLLPSLPVAGGGMTAGLVEAVCQMYGLDIAIGAGTSVFGHPGGPRASARALRRAIEAEMVGDPLGSAAQRLSELRQALQYWGEPLEG
jgi:2,3-diketo-5-methylthiopentyl-1-phosphate enolase